MPINLKDTLNLPKTTFPMRANAVEREPRRLSHWKKTALLQRILEKNKTCPTYLLHDGPPFTNGDVHIGTASNKIIKDIVLRYKSMQGYQVPFYPGWDCHGLPIEHKVVRELRAKGKDLTPSQMRQKCRKFSEHYITQMRDQFDRLGLLADWENEYRTMDPAYEAEILRTFADFVERGLVYRSKKPVYWSIPCETALAEGEIEYKERNSHSVWVTFPLAEPTAFGLPSATSIVVWTTTPWTIPANKAIAVHPKLTYVIVQDREQNYLIAEPLVKLFTQVTNITHYTLGAQFSGQQLEGINTYHPFIDRLSPIVLADYVTTDYGTGCVHTAPGHGLDDYFTALKYGIDIYCPIDDQGRYQDDGQIPKELVGCPILSEKNQRNANTAVLQMLEASGHLLKSEHYSHQYPHCWRSKTPVIFRAVDQWFVGLDKSNLRQQALEIIKNVDWIPSWGETRISSTIEARPDWCISRQRSWGTPIPAFFDATGKPLLDASVIRQLANKVQEHGTDIWFNQSAEQLLAGIQLPDDWNNGPLTKGIDTLDVWIDSGCSHRAVLKNNPELTWPADLYLEGNDQHRGWFQSSLWTSLVAFDSPPYRRVLTHGFIVDEDGKKISKSSDGPQNAADYVGKYGADILRLWIASEDYQNDIPFSDNILKQIVSIYRTIRNTLRFQLGNLYDFDYTSDAVSMSDLTPLDQWALKELATLIQQVTAAYEAFSFHKACKWINQFCTVTLSAIYHDILKDRLYTHAPTWQTRRSSQTAIHIIFRTLTRLLAPILPFTTDEAFALANADESLTSDSIHLQGWPTADPDWHNPAITTEIDTLLTLRHAVNEQLEAARQAKNIGQSLDARVIITGSPTNHTFQLLLKHHNYLPEIFIVSQVELQESDQSQMTVRIAKALGERCPRSWRWVPQLVPTDDYGRVSPRCREALLNKMSTA